jgi:hypothetical protein
MILIPQGRRAAITHGVAGHRRERGYSMVVLGPGFEMWGPKRQAIGSIRAFNVMPSSARKYHHPLFSVTALALG